MIIRRTGGLILALLAATACAQTGEHDWSDARALAEGLLYCELSVTEPRPMNLYCLRVDGQNPWVEFQTTAPAPTWAPNNTETLRKASRQFLMENRMTGIEMVVAINADAFSPWPVPWDEESLTDLLGMAVSEGVLVSPPSGTPSFVVFKNGSMAITTEQVELESVDTAVSGFAMVLADGVTLTGKSTLAPRTGIGLSGDSRYAYFMVIDGRRVESQGATTEEVGAWLKYFGASDGINMDGGGSSTMVCYDPAAGGNGVVLLNSPVGNGVSSCDHCPPTERHNGNNIGIVIGPDSDGDGLPERVETDTGKSPARVQETFVKAPTD